MLGVDDQSIAFVLQADEFANGCRDKQSVRNKMVLESCQDLIGAFVVGVLLT